MVFTGVKDAGLANSMQIAEIAFGGPVLVCPVDWNGDGSFDSADFLDFLADFSVGDADFNNDGATNSADLLEFLAAFSDPPPGC